MHLLVFLHHWSHHLLYGHRRVYKLEQRARPTRVFHVVREPIRRLDKIAFKYGIFKVETCGDSYIAICGFPEPRKRHATAVARFARDTMGVNFQEIIQRLQVTLGPATSDLKMRVGLHSGMYRAVLLSPQNIQTWWITSHTANLYFLFLSWFRPSNRWSSKRRTSPFSAFWGHSQYGVKDGDHVQV